MALSGFCALQPLGGGDRRGERQAVKQFPPSESHSGPHISDWGLTPARRWHKHGQTKDLSLTGEDLMVCGIRNVHFRNISWQILLPGGEQRRSLPVIPDID